MENEVAVTGTSRSYDVSDNTRSLMELYKTEFGDDWKRMFEATVRIDLHRAT